MLCFLHGRTHASSQGRERERDERRKWEWDQGTLGEVIKELVSSSRLCVSLPELLRGLRHQNTQLRRTHTLCSSWRLSHTLTLTLSLTLEPTFKMQQQESLSSDSLSGKCKEKKKKKIHMCVSCHHHSSFFFVPASLSVSLTLHPLLNDTFLSPPHCTPHLCSLSLLSLLLSRVVSSFSSSLPRESMCCDIRGDNDCYFPIWQRWNEHVEVE